MPNQWTKGWDGGRTYRDRGGETIYLLERQHRTLKAAGLPQRVRICLGAITEKQARAQLAAFDGDPVAFVRARTVAPVVEPEKGPQPIHVDGALVESFLKYLRDDGRTERHVRNVGFYLAAWGADLAGRDLRSVGLADLIKILDGYPRKASITDAETGKVKEIVKGAARRHRIASLKSLTAYLRAKARLKASEDPTLSLEVPQTEPEKTKRARMGGRKGYEMRDVEKLYAAVSAWVSKRPGWSTKSVDVQSVRDVVLLHCKTGMHATEIDRLAKGEGTVRVLKGQEEIAATITFLHKKGKMHVQSIDRQTLGAVQRLQARGSAPAESYIKKVVARALTSIGKDPVRDAIRLGELRHSFVTWAAEEGVLVRPKAGGLPLSEIADAIGHESTAMTRTRYDNRQVPPMVKVPIKLGHPEDPLLLAPGKKDQAG